MRGQKNGLLGTGRLPGSNREKVDIRGFLPSNWFVNREKIYARNRVELSSPGWKSRNRLQLRWILRIPDKISGNYTVTVSVFNRVWGFRFTGVTEKGVMGPVVVSIRSNRGIGISKKNFGTLQFRSRRNYHVLFASISQGKI